MDTEKCTALLAAIETGSLSVAGEHLGYSPSGMSRMIASMERETGIMLLKRDSSGVTATEQCKRLLPVIRRLASDGETYRQLSADLLGKKIGTLAVGTAYPLFYPWLANALSSYCLPYPDIQIRIQDGCSSDLCRKLSDHQLDLCIVSQRPGDMAWIPLFRDPLVAWVPKNGSYASEEEFSLEKLSTEPYIHVDQGKDTDNLRMFSRTGMNPNICYIASDSYAAYAMVEAGLGISINNAITASQWNGNVAILPLKPYQEVEIGIAAAPDVRQSPVAEDFFRYLKEKLKNAGESYTYKTFQHF